MKREQKGRVTGGWKISATLFFFFKTKSHKSKNIGVYVSYKYLICSVTQLVRSSICKARMQTRNFNVAPLILVIKKIGK